MRRLGAGPDAASAPGRRGVRPRLSPGRDLGPFVRTGADANAYIFSTAPTESFVNSAAAAVVRTTADTQYVRVSPKGTTRPVGGFIAGSDTVRGMTAAEIKDRLALPYLPDLLTIVRVPAGTCILTGSGAPILGNFPRQSPSIPVGGPWGSGGTAQSLLIGRTDDPNCANPQFLPSDAYTNRQLIGGQGPGLCAAGRRRQCRRDRPRPSIAPRRRSCSATWTTSTTASTC